MTQITVKNAHFMREAMDAAKPKIESAIKKAVARQVSMSVFDRKVRKKPVPHEQNDCIALNGCLEILQTRHAFTYTHIPNGGKRSIKTARAMKAMGVKKGVWDYIFRAKGLPVIWLEMKHGSGDLSDEQKNWRTELSPLGDVFLVAYSHHSALEMLRNAGLFPHDAFSLFGDSIRLNINYPLRESLYAKSVRRR